MDPADSRLVLGTAGHIDHGKTALIRALTGVETDRLPEERARGITIDLGFAPLDLEGGLRLGVIDVPGHEGLVRTMVSGATGIDLVLLVVAADEGCMPQTREHLAICHLLGVGRGVVALTKCDLASPDLLELAEADVAEELAGTPLEGAPLVRVSALTGEGIDALRSALAECAAAAPPRTPRSGPPRLAIDRAFAARGFGSVVTGTLVGGALRVGDAVELLPGGARGRVRGLQSHGRAAEEVPPGVRCAVNLQGISLGEISRGQVVTRPDALEPTASFDAELHWLSTSPPAEPPVSVELLTGTAERRARLAPVGAEALVPGEGGFARVHVDGPPLPVLPGDRFVVRGFAPTAMGGSTLGGGVVLDVAPPRRRRSDPVLRGELERLAGGDAMQGLAVRIQRAGLAGIGREALRRHSGLDPEALDRALDALAAAGRARVTPAGTWIEVAGLEDLARRLGEALDAFHRDEPLQPGMPAAALRGRLPANVPRDLAEASLAGLVAAGDAVVEDDRVRRPSHRPSLSDEEEILLDRVLEEAQAAGLEPPGLREWSERLETDPERLRPLLAHLERRGDLVRAREDLWFARAHVDALRERVIAHLERHGRLETPDYKALIGTPRRTAVPLMELFDAEHLTLRRGDARLLRRSS